jgi:hypothetical protein
MRVSTAVASARIVLDASGVTLPNGKRVTGIVVANATNGSLRGITVQDTDGRHKALVRVKGDDLRNVTLNFSTQRDRATLAAFTAAV